MPTQPRFLVLDSALPGIGTSLPVADAEVVRSANLSDALGLLRTDDTFTAVIVPPGMLTELNACLNGEAIRQQKLDALHRAGQELAALDADQLSEMNVETRIEYLKDNLRRTIRDLLNYDVIEIRLLNRQTGQLVPLLAEGMTDQAANRVLYARTEDNGVTGFVAATGRSYLCRDTVNDPHYIQGAPEARSSLTVPLLYHDEVIGTFNIENPGSSGFSQEDLQFTELFSREIAQSLHTLQLLSAQQSCTATQSINAINRDIAMPVDEVLTLASSLLVRLGPMDHEAGESLIRIITNMRVVRHCVQKVGDDCAPLSAGPSIIKGMPISNLKGLRVLVVDHDERVRRSAHSLLDRYGCQVETAATGMEGLALANTGSYDAVLADIRLPDLGGYETYRRFKAAQPESRLMLMTEFGYDSAHSIVKARADGMRCVLFKPFRQEQVVSALLSPIPDGQPEPMKVS